MARNGTKSRLFRRGDRWWADLRAFIDVGGRRQPLVAPGETVATTDRTVAETLLADRLRELQERRRNRTLLGYEGTAGLAEHAAEHLKKKARSGRFTFRWLQLSEHHLRRAVDFFGADRDLASISVRDVQAYTHHLLGKPSPRGSTLSAGTVRQHLNTLSNLYRRAQSESVVAPGYNPVAAMMDKPKRVRREAEWLEVHEAALLLESARRYRPSEVAAQLGPVHGPTMLPLLATFLLTGGRKQEVLGLEVGDVSFDRQTVTFRPNGWRGLKTQSAHRMVPLWPQLEEILQRFVFHRDAPLAEDGLLFPSPRTGAMIHDVRKALDAIATRAGWKAGEIRLHQLRHTYCAARLQTLDHGAPISPFTVARELGHGGTSLVERVYGHLGSVRHRSEAVEYRVENHSDTLRERLEALD
ncbi:MAG: tyrosine-type recombinase/integrase [Gemmatimonadota bacterium]